MASFNAPAREIWLTAMAASPAKKSTVVPGPGIALSVKIALWTNVMASFISWLEKPQDLPSSLHAFAPQPRQIAESTAQFWYLKSGSTRFLPAAAATACSQVFGRSLTRSVLTNRPNGEVENG